MFTLLLMNENQEKQNKLEELYITYHKELYYVAYRILHDYQDAEDIIQNAFVKISKYLEKIGEIKCKKTRAYLVIIVRNLSFDRYNERKRITPVDFLEETEEEIDGKQSLEDYVLNLERGQELAAALSKINPGYADILALKYYYEYSIPEIAELINTSYNFVSVKLNRAKAALKKILSEGGDKNE